MYTFMWNYIIMTLSLQYLHRINKIYINIYLDAFFNQHDFFFLQQHKC